MSQLLPKIQYSGSYNNTNLSTSLNERVYGQNVKMIGNTMIIPAKKSIHSNDIPKEEMIVESSSLEKSKEEAQISNKEREKTPFSKTIQINQINHRHSMPKLQNQQSFLGDSSPLNFSPILHSNPVASRGSMLNPIFLSDANQLPDALGSFNHLNPIGFNLGLKKRENSKQYFVQPIIVKKDKKVKEKKKKKKEKKEREEQEEREVQKPIESLLNNYLEKQNQIMARILRDIEDDKRRDFLKQKELIDQNLFRGSFSLSPRVLNTDGGYNPNWDRYPAYPNPRGSQFSNQPQFQNHYSNATSPIIQRRVIKPTQEEIVKSMSKQLPEKKPLPRKPNRVRGRKLLKKFWWTLALPGMWWMSVSRWSEQRKEAELKTFKHQIPENLEKFLELAAEAVGNEVKNFVTEKNSMIIVPNSNLKIAEVDKRCKTICEHLILIIDNLSLQIDSGKLQSDFFEFLHRISENDGIVPDPFLSSFEISRLDFNMFGSLKHMNEWRTKMILASFLLLKGIIYFMMLRSWTVVTSILQKQVNFNNILNACSVLYHIVVEILEERISQISRPESPPFKAEPPIFQSLDDDVMNKVNNRPVINMSSQEIILGFYSKDQLSELFQKRPQMIKQVKDSVCDFLHIIYDISHNSLQNKWHVKKRFMAERLQK